jgi:hypothetical protein
MKKAPVVMGFLSYQELFDETLKRIPAHSPEWTNFNESDPGVTLVQLFAWLTESLLYRANNIPEHDRARLRKIARRLCNRRCRARVLITGGSKKARSVPANFIASKLGLDVYRVDLATVTSKYIGETEKNLRRIFDQAERTAAILFFDEADALFGKRSEVKDSHDPHANQDAVLLLRRLEHYEGLVMLGTNRKENLDPDVLSRFRFVIPVSAAANDVGQDSKVLLRHSVFCTEPIRRPNYFTGQLLGAEDFIAEQEYHRGQQRRHNLHCHGIGVVSGLTVSTENGKGGSTVVVEPGVAIDAAGNELHLCMPARFPLPTSPAVIQVGILFSERFAGSIPMGIPGESETVPAHVEEGCEIVLETLPLTPDASVKHCPAANSADVLPLARLIRRGSAWRLDRRFKVSRIV